MGQMTFSFPDTKFYREAAERLIQFRIDTMTKEQREYIIEMRALSNVEIFHGFEYPLTPNQCFKHEETPWIPNDFVDMKKVCEIVKQKTTTKP